MKEEELKTKETSRFRLNREALHCYMMLKHNYRLLDPISSGKLLVLIDHVAALQLSAQQLYSETCSIFLY